MGRMACIAVAAGASLLLTCSGSVGPYRTVNGVTFAGGNVMDTEFFLGTLVNALGGSFSAVGKVTIIWNDLLNPTWQVGTNGRYMTAVLTGFTVTSITLSGAAFRVMMSGGSLKYYVGNSDPNVTTGTQATDLANAASGALWLNLVPTSSTRPATRCS
jgi:hypothetical protein